jgi:SNF2 family DNA or RNA helicase
MIKVTDSHVFVQPIDEGMGRVLEKHFRAPKLKQGYRLPKTYGIMRELVETFPTLKANAGFVAAGKELRAELDRLTNLRSATVPQLTTAGLVTLRPYQWQDASYLCELEAGAVFNEPRTGKTPTIIEVLRRKDLENTLVVCPASLVHYWKAEFEKFWGVRTTIIQGKGTIERINGVSIISKSLLPKMDVQTHYDAIVVDEAHFLRNYASAQSKAIYGIKAKHRYALTGTPIVNDGTDMYGILHFLYPKLFPSYWQFVDMFFESTTNRFGANEVRKPGDIIAYRKKAYLEMVAMWSVQRLRKDVMKWLPPKQHQTILVDMDAKQRKAYRDMKKTFEAKDEFGNETDAQNILTRLSRIRQICQDPALLGLNIPSAKTKALIEFIENNPNEPIVVMSWFTSYLKLLEPLMKELGRKVGMIHGEVPSAQKHKNASDFQSGKLDLVLCNTISAGTGFTLDTGNTVLFLDKPWTYAELEQAEDRICPTVPGKDLKHNIVSIVCKASIDQRIDRILSKKKDVVDIVKMGSQKIMRELLNDEGDD